LLAQGLKTLLCYSGHCQLSLQKII
jgi:hypothetical protein